MTERSWLFDELGHAGPEHLDPEFVTGYDRKQGHPQAAADIEVFGSHGLTRAATVIDFGAGTGQFALPAAGHIARVIAVDISPEMIRVLQTRADDAGLRNLVCVQSGFLGYEHLGPQVDGVFTRNALHDLPDFFKGIALDRIARLLRPAGILRLRDLIFDCEPSGVESMFDHWFTGAASDPATGYTAADLAGHVRDEFSTYRWLLEPLLEATGFEILNVEYRQSVYGTYTCRRR